MNAREGGPGLVRWFALCVVIAVVSFAAGGEAALHLYPRREFARTWEEIARARGKNVWSHEERLADETARRIVRPNNDTLYSSAAVDMADGPRIVTAPGSDRYWSIEFIGDTTDVFAYVGSRELGADRGARVLLVPPGFAGDAQGLQVIHAPSRKVWLMARFLVDGPQDLARAAHLQQELTIAPWRGP